MSQSGYTPIQLYRTTTASAIPTAGNLAAGELAINTTDGKLYFKTTGGTVTLLASSAGASGSVTSVDGSGGTTGLTLTGGPITTSGTLTLGGTLAVANGGTGVTTSTGSGSVVLSTSPTLTTPVLGAASATSVTNGLGTVSAPSFTFTGDTNTGIYSPTADQVAIATNGTQRMLVYGTGFFDGVFSDKVVAIGNTGTAQTLDVSQGNVFTATLTGNCTFTLSGANAASSRASSFTLVLTNDGTAGRTVAFAGGTFRYPGGSVTRTTTANAVDVWFFFTPNNGTTWYVSIPMANLS